MNVFIPILPAVLLGALCAILGYWNLRKIDQFLAEHADPAEHTPSTVADTPARARN